MISLIQGVPSEDTDRLKVSTRPEASWVEPQYPDLSRVFSRVLALGLWRTLEVPDWGLAF